MSAGTTRIFLFRHEEVDADWRGRIYGALDVPLSASGRAAARKTASALEGIELAAVVSSGLSRTEHTAAHLRAARALERIDDPGLRELERGDWAGLHQDELERLHPGAFGAWFRTPAESRPPRGESLADLLARVQPRLQHWAQRHAGRSIALITHGWVVRVLVCEALGAPLALAPRLDVRTGDIHVLRWPDRAGSLELEAFALDRSPLLATTP